MATTINSGIYTITNKITGRIYVGSSVDTNVRKVRHFNDLQRNVHPNSHLQRSFNKHGEPAFVFEVIERCNAIELIAREQFWIDEKRNNFNLYNLAPKAYSQLGIKRTEETKRRMSESQKGHKTTEEAKQKMALAKIGTSYRKGKKASEETRGKISEAKKGTSLSEETRKLLSLKRLGNKNALGFKQSPEIIRKRMESSRLTRERKKLGVA